MKGLLTLIIITFFSINSFSQYIPEEKMKKKLKASKIELDEGNEDGVFKAQDKKSKKWGMYQYLGEGENVIELIPPSFDSLNYFPFNGSFTAVYKEGKVGFYLAQWSYGKDAKQTVECLYEDYQRFNANNATHLAVSKNGKWGWVDWFTGEEKSEFIYETKEALPYPNYEQKSW